MGQEGLHQPEVQKEGAKWLDMLGYGHLSGLPSPYEKDGVPILWDDFTDICGEQARPFLTGIEVLDKDDRRRKLGIEFIIQKYIIPHIAGQPENLLVAHGGTVDNASLPA